MRMPIPLPPWSISFAARAVSHVAALCLFAGAWPVAGAAINRDMAWLVHVDVETFNRTTLGTLESERPRYPATRNEWRAIGNLFAFDPMTNVVSVTAFGPDHTATSTVIVVQGECRRLRLAALEQTGVLQRDTAAYRGGALYIRAVDGPSAALRFAYYTADTAVLGPSRAAVTATVAGLLPRASSRIPVRCSLPLPGLTPGLFFVALGRTGVGQAGEQARARMPLFRNVRSAGVTLSEQAGTVAAHLHLLFDNAAHAAAGEQLIKAAFDLVELSIDIDPAAERLTELLNAIQFTMLPEKKRPDDIITIPHILHALDIAVKGSTISIGFTQPAIALNRFLATLEAFVHSTSLVPARARQAARPLVDRYFHEAALRHLADDTLLLDRFVLYPLYAGMILVGYGPYPEASIVLYHTLTGNGKAVRLPAHYLRQSPTVRNAIETLGPGHHRDLRAGQDDRRLYYALNPYSVIVQGKKRVVYDIVDWPTDPKVCTVICPGLFAFNLPDVLTRAVGPCKPFRAYAEWDED